MVSEREVIKVANNLLRTKKYLECCFTISKPPDDVFETLLEMVELYRQKGLRMMQEYEQHKQEEKDYVTFMEERGLG